ncbi:multicomponent Na+:H+ antiporter subunit B [Candidatus Xenohaliotis californiensis]|uniref:Multicomponent Na+:H+ antiporter subunit B n=1 Tax=Candidatus Xenohaliotis californiensis TaxID=84677 RepID=A0ABM9N7V0_9RICK|nr:multicomponent Na+:H+ antiporter subunit B [Candidatus Xenohaliotis californiensis]
MKKKINHDMAIVLSSFLMIPAILLYGLYLQINGEDSPGGGFQAGVVFAVVYILYVSLFDYKTASKIVPTNFFLNGLSLGVLLYLGTGCASMLMGGNFLEYAVFSNNFAKAQYIGVFLIELGVGLTVFCAMVIFYISFILYDGRNR